MTNESPWKTKEEAAEYLRCCQLQVDRYRKAGLLPPPIVPGVRQRVLFHITWLTACEKKLRMRRELGLRTGDTRLKKTKRSSVEQKDARSYPMTSV